MQTLVIRSLGLACLLASLACGPAQDPPVTDEPKRAEAGTSDVAPPAPDSEPPAPDSYAGSPACESCHADAFESWQRSHHARAEREIDLALDADAFEDGREIEANGLRYRMKNDAAGHLAIEMEGRDGEVREHPVVRAFGYVPLRQYLIDVGGGHQQVTQLAFDPERREWFDVFGDDPRSPGDWGHWSGRGMSWNSRCAHCHNTGVEQGYDDRKDEFETQMEEIGVGCEACHGPAADHVAWRESAATRAGAEGGQAASVAPDPLVGRTASMDRVRIEAVCASCHSRRSLANEDFLPGDRYLDHFVPAYRDEGPLYYPDGQVRDEDFVAVSFWSTDMHASGQVSCHSCHEPHSGELVTPGNELCLGCHRSLPDFSEHSHHAEGTPGNACVDCHMPTTTYMARDVRRDHGFGVPDPQLTIELDIPNACDRCHAEKGAAWAAQRVGEWYSTESMEARRADPRAVAAARQGDITAIPRLIEMAAPGGKPLRRATATRLLGVWAHDPQIQGVLAQQTEDAEAWVRMAAASALGFQAQRLVPGAEAALSALFADPVRAVRIEAQRSLRHRHDFTDPEMSDLRSAMVLQLAQPGGQAEFGSWLLARGDAQRALPHLERAAEWDPWSPEFQRILAVNLASLGRSDEALERVERAVALAPEDPFLRFELALAYNETGRREDVIRELRGVVERAPAFSRAWYNLGLALRDSGELDAALEALSQAEATEPSAAAPFARALILKEQGRRDEAIEAVETALQRDPRDSSAAGLLVELRAEEMRPPQP